MKRTTVLIILLAAAALGMVCDCQWPVWCRKPDVRECSLYASIDADDRCVPITEFGFQECETDLVECRVSYWHGGKESPDHQDIDCDGNTKETLCVGGRKLWEGPCPEQSWVEKIVTTRGMCETDPQCGCGGGGI